ncbi:DUF3106 domain-containing protein [Duganella sp. FT92W]|uniref:DUF3106 domain-containing protein n=1 Tax=Pseudoduganella rivuli TaxID=2666085 RepID=A0A7X2ITC2_9BURK|nr:DUF3106 domain-containing protein [Pseudoduganella rivuli]MRV75649.1 DUF3106 domain-containing protein [Pseudoduganella rivuli]
MLVSALLAAGAFAQAPVSSTPPAAPPAASAIVPAPQASAPASVPASALVSASAAQPAAGKPAPGGKPAVAPIAMEKPLWKDLSAAQQRALEPLKGEWDKLEGLRKQKWLEIANRYNAMKPDEQARVQERMRDWVRLTPDQRRMVRENFARSQKVAPVPGQKSAQWEQYQQLPEEQKKQLADKAPKKQVVNPPSPAQSKIQTVQPVKRVVPGATPAAPAAGTTPVAGAPAPVPAAAPAAPGTPAPAAASATSTPPASNAK